jgi:hypothetical protein
VGGRESRAVAVWFDIANQGRRRLGRYSARRGLNACARRQRRALGLLDFSGQVQRLARLVGHLNDNDLAIVADNRPNGAPVMGARVTRDARACA